MVEIRQGWAGWWGDLDLQAIAFAALIIVAAMAFRRPIARLALRFARFLLSSFGVDTPEAMEAKLVPAVSVLVGALGFLLGVLVLDLPPASRDLCIKLAGSVAAIAVFSGTNGFLDPIEDAATAYHRRRANLEIIWIVRIVRIASAVVTFALILRVWGIDIAALLTGLGVFGAALAFILQDLLRNLVAGLNNSNENRFTVGDWIRVDGIADGTVIATGLRSTTIRGFDLSISQVPNQELANRPLVNLTRRPHRRIYWEIDLTYGTTAEQLAEICRAIESFIAESDDFVATPITPRFVRLESFGSSSIKMLVYCFTRTNDWAEFLRVKEELAIAIKRIVEGAGASFAFPSRSIYLERADAGGFGVEAAMQGGSR